MSHATYVVWGAELSPFLLKLEALLTGAAVPYRRLPRDGTRLENLRTALLVESAKRRRTALRPPSNDALDEYPLVPFLIAPDRRVLYDSSALARWLDDVHPAPPGPLVPTDPALRFVTLLIDEAFDEFGLYMVHHNRWKLAALDNDHPGMRLAREYARQLPPGSGRVFGPWFERRQVRRLPYLFSVAPQGYSVPGLDIAVTPPSRAGFPPTHQLLEDAWKLYLEAVEGILTHQPFFLGERFTLADASAYGQLSMNLTDPAAARRLHELAPTTFEWLNAIRSGRHGGAAGPLALSPRLAPLLAIVLDTFVPLMRANEAAYAKLPREGAGTFNEKGFDAGKGLYDGELLGRPFRTGIKTFQVRSWRDLRNEWTALPSDAQGRLASLAPGYDMQHLFAPS